MARWTSVIPVAWAICLAGGAAWGSAQDPLQGEEAFEGHCVRCHRLSLPMERPKSSEQWKVTIARMAERRVRLKQEPIPEETQTVLAEYLAAR